MEQISHQSNKTPLLKRLLPIVAVFALVFVLLSLMSGMKEEPAKVPAKPSGFLVETTTVTPTALTLTIESQGVLQPKRQIALLTEVSGKVQSLSPAFVAGGTFAAGDVLVQIDPADYRVAVARAEANLASAQATLDLEQARSDQARKDWNSFGKTGEPSALLLNIPQLDGAKASRKAAQADLQKARRDLEKTTIVAPFAGTVLSKSVDLGQFVGMSGQLGTIAGTEVGEVRLPLTNQDLDKLNLKDRDLLNQPLAVTFADDQGQTITSGQIKRLEASKDARTLMNYAVAEISQPFEHDLLFNTFLKAEISGGTYANVYAIPAAWMMPNDQLPVYLEDDTLAIKQVHVVHKTNDHFYVDQGLNSQDLIITTPIQAPTVGMTLRLEQPADESTDVTPAAAVQTAGAKP